MHFFTLKNSLAQENVILSDAAISYQPRPEVKYLWDKEKKLSLQQIVLPKWQSQFKSSGIEPISFGITDSDIWFKIDVKNTIPEQENTWVFELAYAHYDSLELYFQNKHGEWEKWLTGDLTPFDTRKIANKHFAFPVVLEDTLTKTYYFHVSGEGSLQFPLYIKSRDNYEVSKEKVSVVYGIFFGIIAIMILYNFFIYLFLEDKSYLFYVLSITCLLFFYLANTGYGYQYVWSNYPMYNLKMIPIGIVLAGLTGTLFCRRFLDTKKYVPLIDKVLLGTIVVYLFEFVLLIFLNYKWLIIITSSLTFITSLLIMFASYLIWFKGNRSARFIALAFSFYLIGILLLTLNVRGLLNRSFISVHSMEIGTAIEITLLSLALSDRYSLFRREKEKAQAELIEIQRRANEELEKKVMERTLQINQQKTELQESNRVKDKLLSIISHDLKGPLNAFQSLLSMMLKDDLTHENISMYTLHLNNKLGLMIGLVDNILQWVRSQMEGIRLDIQQVSLKEIVKENVHLFSSQAELKNISIIDEVPENLIIQSDKNVMRLVIRNLLNNALKFTDKGGKVYISAEITGDCIIMSIRDTGVGMSREKINNLFTGQYFAVTDTNKEGGTGLGLLLCNEFLGKVSGKIWVESEIGKGSNFKFTQPV